MGKENKITLPSCMGKDLFIICEEGYLIYELHSKLLPSGEIKLIGEGLVSLINFAIPFIDKIQTDGGFSFKNILTEEQGVLLASEMKKALIPIIKEPAELYTECIEKIKNR